MGNVLHLRKPSRKLGYDDVMLVPRGSIADTARAVLASPADNTESMLRAACIWLRDNGDWVDQERARHLLQQLDREARRKADDAAWWARERRELALAGLLILVCVAAISVFDVAWGQHLAVGMAR